MRENRRKMPLDAFKLVIVEVFTYSTVRSATIFSVKVGLVYRAVQILILSYIIGYELIHNKAYQVSDTVSSIVTFKVKGQGFVFPNSTLERNYLAGNVDYFRRLFELDRNKSYKILDTADYVIPPNEYNSIFVMTNFIKTYQTEGYCDEEIWKYRALCKADQDCPKYGTIMNSWNGIPTGKCINSSINSNLKACQIKAWCPAEHDNERFEDNIIRNVLNYTIFIKNDVEFKRFNKKLRNILPNITNKYLSNCVFDEINDPYCPVFRINYILHQAELNETERYLMLLKGGVIQIEITWNCNFDIYAKKCLPAYTFTRFDLPFHEAKSASGFNFRYTNKFMNNAQEKRVLYKAYGLRFIITVSGKAGKFSIVPLMITIGAGVGLMSVSVLIADCVMLYCTKDKKIFQQVKSLRLNQEIKSQIEEQDDEDVNVPIVRV